MRIVHEVVRMMTEGEGKPRTSVVEVTGRQEPESGWARLYIRQCPPSALVTLALRSRPRPEFQGCREAEAKAFGLDIISSVRTPNCSSPCI